MQAAAPSRGGVRSMRFLRAWSAPTLGKMSQTHNVVAVDLSFDGRGLLVVDRQVVPGHAMQQAVQMCLHRDLGPFCDVRPT